MARVSFSFPSKQGGVGGNPFFSSCFIFFVTLYSSERRCLDVEAPATYCIGRRSNWVCLFFLLSSCFISDLAGGKREKAKRKTTKGEGGGEGWKGGRKDKEKLNVSFLFGGLKGKAKKERKNQRKERIKGCLDHLLPPFPPLSCFLFFFCFYSSHPLRGVPDHSLIISSVKVCLPSN